MTTDLLAKSQQYSFANEKSLYTQLFVKTMRLNEKSFYKQQIEPTRDERRFKRFLDKKRYALFHAKPSEYAKKLIQRGFPDSVSVLTTKSHVQPWMKNNLFVFPNPPTRLFFKREQPDTERSNKDEETKSARNSFSRFSSSEKISSQE